MGSFPLRLPYGDYQVKELETAPWLRHYERVHRCGTGQDRRGPGGPSQTPKPWYISLRWRLKLARELPGAVLELYAPDGSLLDTWETSDIPHVIPGLPVGEGYVLREVTAPEGF